MTVFRVGVGVSAILVGCSLFPDTAPTVGAAGGGGGSAGAAAGAGGNAGSSGGGGTAGIAGGDGGLDGSAGCGTTTLTIPVTADTYLTDVPPGETHGSEAFMRIRCFSASSGYRGLLRFVLDDIPPKATISKAVVKLVLIQNGGGTHELGFHRVTRTWNEAQASWQEAATNGDWATNGGDIEVLAAATQDVDPTVGVGTAVEWDVTDDIKAYLGGDPNNGWIIKENLSPFTGEELRFATRETTASATRPKLDVDYTLCP